MALVLNAICSTCCDTTRVTAGSGRLAAGSRFYFPYGCSRCKKVVAVEHLGANAIECPNCGSSELLSFNTAEKWATGEGRYIDIAYCAQIDVDFRLAGHGVAYTCPACMNETLHFESLMRID
jgi:predicted RNA-binding Zn-ribbon protein involved in translation (DUF1610 family)